MSIDNSTKDHWTQEAYSISASFVPELASKILQWLDPQLADVILDLGCGDGTLTSKIKTRCSIVVGVDASANMIEAARKRYGNNSSLNWHKVDCRYLEKYDKLGSMGFDKVFSNAALHWIMRDPSTRLSVLRNTYEALKPGGTFVFEMGGAGNVADVHAALLAALVHQGVSIERAREACPWVFPSENMMRQMLEKVGFEVQKIELAYRPTRLTTEKDGGLEGWVRLMGANFLKVLEENGKREAAVREVCDVLQTVLMHEEDGSMWLGYVRLRAVARK